MAAVEFVISMPVLAVVLIGTIEFGWYYSQLITVNSAAYDAARHAALEDTAGAAAVRAEATGLQLLLDLGFCTGGFICDVDGNRRVINGMLMVEVVMQVQYDQLTGIIPNSGPIAFEAPRWLNARAVMPIVGP
jgi:hypothetical protein